MKQFINVLYRRILYKIPLKFLLILLAIFAVFIAYTKAELVVANTTNLNQQFNSYTKESTADIMCVVINSCTNGNSANFRFILSMDNVGQGNALQLSYYNPSINIYKGMGYCTTGGYLLMSSSYSCDVTITEYNVVDYTSLQCQTEYNLIPISSVDQNYCTTNNLCPMCQVCPAGSGSISTLYINDILHVGSPFIYMNIPEEIGRDYAYTQGGTNMFIDVEGYNVDYDKISDILEVQNYKPTSDDFTQVVSNLTPYVKILVFVLFVFIIWKWIKGGFKSKLK